MGIGAECAIFDNRLSLTGCTATVNDHDRWGSRMTWVAPAMAILAQLLEEVNAVDIGVLLALVWLTTDR